MPHEAAVSAPSTARREAQRYFWLGLARTLTVRDVAAELRCSEDEVRALIRNGELQTVACGSDPASFPATSWTTTYAGSSTDSKTRPDPQQRRSLRACSAMAAEARSSAVHVGVPNVDAR